MTPREAELTSQLEMALRENALLRQKIDLLVRRVFGSTSEKLSPGQLELLLALSGTAPAVAAAAEKPATPSAVRPQKERAPRLPEHLPVVEEVLDPEPVKAAPDQWRRIGEEVSEQLDYDQAVPGPHKV
jgi:transposase